MGSLLIKDIKRLWPNYTLNIALGVQVYGEVLYLKFYSVFSEQFISNEILLCKDCKCTSSCENVILHTIKE